MIQTLRDNMIYALVGAEAAQCETAAAYTPQFSHLAHHVPQLLLRIYEIAAPNAHQGHNVRGLLERRPDERRRGRQTAAMQRRARADFHSQRAAFDGVSHALAAVAAGFEDYTWCRRAVGRLLDLPRWLLIIGHASQCFLVACPMLVRSIICTNTALTCAVPLA